MIFALSLSMMLHYIIVLVFLCENVKTTNILIFLWEYKFCMCQIDQMSFNTWMPCHTMPCHVIPLLIPYHFMMLNVIILMVSFSISFSCFFSHFHLLPIVSIVHLSVFRLSLIHIWRCRRSTLCRSRWSPYH